MRVLFVLFLVLFAVPAFSQSPAEPPVDADLEIRVFLEPENGVYVGQLARLWVEISNSSQFAGAPRYPDLQLEGAIVIMPDQLGVNFSERVQGGTRIGQRQRYVIIPQREGTLVIPALKVTVSTLVDNKTSNPITLESEPIKLNAIFPPGMGNLEQIITTEKLAVTEGYDREVDDLRVGDAITRTVTLRGENTFALALPAIEFVPIPGTRVYPAQSEFSDQTNRGQYSGTRIDAGTYVLEQAREILLPEIVVRWWNPESKSQEKTVLPAVSFQVDANPDFQNSADSQPEKISLAQKLKRGAFELFVWFRSNIVWLTVAAICLFIVAAMWKRFSSVLFQSWKNWRASARVSEAHYFAEFRRACLSNNLPDITRTFWRWIDCRYSGTQIPVLKIQDMREMDADISNYFTRLEQQHYGRKKEQQMKMDGREFYGRVKQLRKTIKTRPLTNPYPDFAHLNPGRI